jgi:hypothetical protein
MGAVAKKQASTPVFMRCFKMERIYLALEIEPPAGAPSSPNGGGKLGCAPMWGRRFSAPEGVTFNR